MEAKSSPLVTLWQNYEEVVGALHTSAVYKCLECAQCHNNNCTSLCSKSNATHIWRSKQCCSHAVAIAMILGML
jgi:hypothetical protein